MTLALRAVALEGRLDSMSARLRALDERLSGVETNLLESVYELPVAEVHQPVDESVVESVPEDERVAVPKLDFDEVRMSSTAAQALFGG